MTVIRLRQRWNWAGLWHVPAWGPLKCSAVILEVGLFNVFDLFKKRSSHENQRRLSKSWAKVEPVCSMADSGTHCTKRGVLDQSLDMPWFKDFLKIFEQGSLQYAINWGKLFFISSPWSIESIWHSGIFIGFVLTFVVTFVGSKDFSVTNFDYFGDIFQAWCLVPAESKVRHATLNMSHVSLKDQPQLERSKLHLVSACWKVTQFSVIRWVVCRVKVCFDIGFIMLPESSYASRRFSCKYILFFLQEVSEVSSQLGAPLFNFLNLMQSIDIEADTPQTGELLPEALATAYGGMHMDSWIEKLLASDVMGWLGMTW